MATQMTDVRPDSTADAAPARRTVKLYDFRRPDKFSKEQLRTLRAIHDNVGRLAAGRLSVRFRTPVTFELAEAAQMVFDEFTQNLVLPTQLLVMTSPGLDGPFLIDLDLGLAAAMVDRMLGGAGAIPAERREPTAIEIDLVDKVVGDLLPGLVEGWSHLHALEPTVTERAYGPALLRVTAPSSVVAVLTWDVRMAGAVAPITICLPHEALGPILPRLSASAWYAREEHSEADGGFRAELEAAIERVEVPVTAILGQVDLAVDDLVDLRVGDIIRLSERAGDPVRLCVPDGTQAWAGLGRVGDRVGLRLTTSMQPLEA